MEKEKNDVKKDKDTYTDDEAEFIKLLSSKANSLDKIVMDDPSLISKTKEEEDSMYVK